MAAGLFTVLLLVLALVAGALSWVVGERTFDYAHPSKAAAENYRDSTALNQQMPKVGAINGALTFGALGLFVGLAMGAGGGLSVRSFSSTLLGGFSGLFLGAAAGALPAVQVMPWHWRHRNDDPATLDLLVPLLEHFALWSAVGLAAGIAFGLASQGGKPYRIFEAAIAGLVGAMFGIFVFEVLGAVLLPMDRTASPFADSSTGRLLARLCVALGIALGLSRAVPSSRPAAMEKNVGEL